MRRLLELVGRPAEGLIPYHCLLKKIQHLVNVGITKFLPSDDWRMPIHKTQKSPPEFPDALGNDHGLGVHVVEVVAQSLEAFLELAILPLDDEEAEDVADCLEVGEIVALLKLR